MTHSYTFQQIAGGLYRSDPMHTSCVENEMTDEYDSLATSVCALMEQGSNIQSALSQAFDESFWSGALTDEKVQLCLRAVQREAEKGQ